MRMTIALALLASSAACSDPPEQASSAQVAASEAAYQADLKRLKASANPADASGNEHSRALGAKSEGERAQILATIISGTGESCDNVTQTMWQGDLIAGASMWNARCDDGADYAISVSSDSATKVMSCKLHNAGRGVCWEPFDS